MEVNISKKQCIQDICRFPILYKELGVTPLDVVSKSGYTKFCREISKKDIVDELKKNKDIITSWINFTQDKRWTPSWGILKENNEYVLFYMSPSAEMEMKQIYKDPYEACALMIRMEMEGFNKK